MAGGVARGYHRSALKWLWAAALVSVASPAGALEGTKVGILGSTKPCRTAIKELLDESTRVVERENIDGRPSSNDPDGMERWVNASVRSGSVDLVLVVDTMDKDTLRLLAFKSGRMVGLRLVDMLKGCRLAPRSAALTRAWLASRMMPASDPPIDPRHSIAAVAPVSPPPELLVPRDPDEEPRVVHANPKPEATAPPKPAEPAPTPTPAPVAAAPVIASKPVASPKPIASAKPRSASEPRDPGEPPDTAAPLETSSPEPAPAVLTHEETPEPASWIELRFGAGLDLVSHVFRWVDPVSPNTRELRFDLVPAPRLTLEVMPFGTGPELVRPLAIVAKYRRVFGLVARRSEGGSEHPLAAQDLELGLAYPFYTVVSGRPLIITPIAVYRDVRFDLGADSAGQYESQLPDGTYLSLSPGVAVDLGVQGRVHLQGRAAYQWVLAIDGGLANEFPDRSVHGVSLSAGLAFAPIEGVELRFSMEWLRYFASFTPTAMSTHLASGASDETLSVSAGAVYRWVP